MSKTQTSVFPKEGKMKDYFCFWHKKVKMKNKHHP